MHRVHDQNAHSWSEMSFAAVAVGIGHDKAPHQLHAGILHAADGNEPEMLHLAWHHQLRNDSPPQTYLWIQPAFDKSRLRQVAAMCRRIFRTNSSHGLPYGFGTPNDVFDPRTGEYLIDGSQYGLTCASFVLAVFHVTGLPLADYTTWPQGRPDDRPWQQFIVNALSRCSSHQGHLDRIRKDIGAVRFHPSEVAASAATARVQSPARFEDIDQLGSDIRMRIARHHISRLFAELTNTPPSDDGTPTLGASQQTAIALALRLAETHRLTPIEVQMKDISTTLLRFRHPYNPRITLEIESDPTGTSMARMLRNGITVISGSFPNAEESVLTGFLSEDGNC